MSNEFKKLIYPSSGQFSNFSYNLSKEKTTCSMKDRNLTEKNQLQLRNNSKPHEELENQNKKLFTKNSQELCKYFFMFLRSEMSKK